MLSKGDDNNTDLLSIKYVEENADDYLVCAKSDGVRYLLFIGSNGRCYLNDRMNRFFEAPMFIPPMTAKAVSGNFDCHIILDGELVLNQLEAKKLEKNPKANVRL